MKSEQKVCLFIGGLSLIVGKIGATNAGQTGLPIGYALRTTLLVVVVTLSW